MRICERHFHGATRRRGQRRRVVIGARTGRRSRALGSGNHCAVAKLLPVVVLAGLLAACSSGSSAAVRDTRVCAAYEAFWDTDYSGGKPSATMLARERRLLDAIAHAPDEKLG